LLTALIPLIGGDWDRDADRRIFKGLFYHWR